MLHNQSPNLNSSTEEEASLITNVTLAPFGTFEIELSEIFRSEPR